MMKIGIITFHWGTNYGGVLQAYALQEYIKKLGSEVQIINYAPHTFRDSFIRCFRTKNPRIAFENIKEYLKEQKFKLFRKNYLNTTRRYFSLDELKKEAPELDVYITGSDQVWNPYFLNTYGPAYFLDFGNDKVKRIAYAVSLGCTKYPTAAMKKIKPCLERFNAISLRENTGLNIMNEMGFNFAKLMPDPTLLLEKSDYEKIMIDNKSEKYNYALFYILQPKQHLILRIYDHVNNKLNMKVINNLTYISLTKGINEWLCDICNSQFVVTNSFHGVIFSMIFQKQFIVIPIEGSLRGMNDRIYTLLQKFGLEDRILDVFDELKFSKIIEKQIIWKEIEKIQKVVQEEAFAFLNKNIFSIQK